MPPDGPYLSSGVMGSRVKIGGQAPEVKFFLFYEKNWSIDF